MLSKNTGWKKNKRSKRGYGSSGSQKLDDEDLAANLCLCSIASRRVSTQLSNRYLSGLRTHTSRSCGPVFSLKRKVNVTFTFLSYIVWGLWYFPHYLPPLMYLKLPHLSRWRAPFSQLPLLTGRVANSMEATAWKQKPVPVSCWKISPELLEPSLLKPCLWSQLTERAWELIKVPLGRALNGCLPGLRDG